MSRGVLRQSHLAQDGLAAVAICVVLFAAVMIADHLEHKFLIKGVSFRERVRSAAKKSARSFVPVVTGIAVGRRFAQH